MSTKSEVEVFPLDAVVSIEISGSFYARLTQLLLDHATSKDNNSLVAAYESLKSGDPKDAYEYHLLTLSSLIKAIEDEVRKENKFEKIDETILQKLASDLNLSDLQSQSQPESQD
jgi:hypothetical protein